MTRANLKLYSDLLAKWVAVIAAIWAGGVTLHEYRVKAQGERITRTLAYIDKLEAGGRLAEARSLIEQFWDTNAPDVQAATGRGEERLSAMVVDLIRGEQNLKYATLEVIRFYDVFRACICARTCDWETANAFLGKDAFDFMGLNYPFIARQRELLKDPHFGRGVIDVGTAYAQSRDLTQEFSCKLTTAH